MMPHARTSRASSHLRRLQGLDSSWAVSNGLNAHNHPAWLQLYLSACKLLDLAVALPADMLPQFQMWVLLREGPVRCPERVPKSGPSTSAPDEVIKAPRRHRPWPRRWHSSGVRDIRLRDATSDYATCRLPRRHLLPLRDCL